MKKKKKGREAAPDLTRVIAAAGEALSEGIQQLPALLGNWVKHTQLGMVEAEAWV